MLDYFSEYHYNIIGDSRTAMFGTSIRLTAPTVGLMLFLQANNPSFIYDNYYYLYRCDN